MFGFDVIGSIHLYILVVISAKSFANYFSLMELVDEAKYFLACSTKF